MDSHRWWRCPAGRSALAPSKEAREADGEADVEPEFFNDRNTNSRSDRIGSDPDSKPAGSFSSAEEI